MAEPLLVLDGLSKRFGEQEAVRGIDLEIAEGEFIALMGPSGCGKTTTLRMIAGLEEPTSGEVRLDGERVNERKPWERDTPMVWQSLALFPYLSVRGNVEFGLKMRGMPGRERRARALKWLEQVGIADYANRNIAQLSGGERQRVALARALVTEPRILLLDEPLSALDAHLRVRMQAEITELQRRLGITFVYVTHNQSEAFAMASRVVIMDAGLIQQIGAPREVYRAPANRFVAEFVGTNNIIEGRVRSAGGGRIGVESAHGTIEAAVPAARAPAVGDAVNLVVSADRVVLDAQAKAHSNAVSGAVISEEFIGSVVTLHLDVGGGTVFRVQKQAHELDTVDITPGQTFHVSWRAEDTYVLPA